MSVDNQNPLPLRVLGIDPGSRYTGYAVLTMKAGVWRYEVDGILRLGEKKPLADRLVLLSQELMKIYSTYRPFLTSIEKVFLGKNVSSAFTLGHARGVILCEAQRAGSIISEHAAKSVKKGVTGYGGADKVQMQKFLGALLGVYEFERDDASDALALALYGARDWENQKKMRATLQKTIAQNKNNERRS